MSTTIGVGYCCKPGEEISLDLAQLAERFGYGALLGIQHAEDEVKEGLSAAKKCEKWRDVVLFRAPRASKGALASGIQDEFLSLEVNGRRPVFFDFLNEISTSCAGRCDKFGIFFAGEWGGNDRIRYSYGSPVDLIALLSMPGNWGGRYLIPKTGRLQDFDDVPLIFDLKL